jgi:hypothetical protein
MKTKLIILLICLLPSISSAMSLRIQLKEVLFEPNAHAIALTYTGKNGFSEHNGFAFWKDARSYKIIKDKENSEKWRKLNLVLSEKLKLKSSHAYEGGEFFPDADYFINLLESRFLELLIGNNWMITDFTSDGVGKFNIFAYKPD